MRHEIFRSIDHFHAVQVTTIFTMQSVELNYSEVAMLRILKYPVSIKTQLQELTHYFIVLFNFISPFKS